MINFKSVKLNNFVVYDSLDFRLETDEPTLVLGRNYDSEVAESNGSGKSLLFESIIFALYGKTERGKPTGEDVLVELEFQSGGDSIKVVRYHNHHEYRNRNKVRLYINGELQDYHTMKETDEAIQNIVGISYHHFISSVILIQNFPKVTELKPSQFNDYFSQFIDFNYDSIIEQLKSKIKYLGVEIDTVTSRLSELNTNKSYLQGKISACREGLKEVQSRLDETYEKIARLERELDEIRNKIDNMKDYAELYTNLVSKRDKLKREMDILSSGRCPLCGSPVGGDYLERYQLSLSRVESAISEYESLKNQYEELLLIERGLISEIRSLKYFAHELENQKKIAESVDMWTRKLESIQSELSEMEKNLSGLKEKESGYKELLRLIQPGGEVRTKVTNYYLNVYYQIVRDIARTIGDEFLSSVSDMSDINYHRLSGGEKSRVNVILHIALADFISRFNRTNFNLIVFDESFDHLDFKSMTNIIEFIKSYFGYKSIYIISHNSELKRYFNRYIIISRKNGRSTVSVEYQY